MAKNSAPKRTLEVHERESIKNRLEKVEEMRQAGQDFREGGAAAVVPVEVALGREKLDEESEHLRRVLDSESPEKVKRGVDRNRILEKRKELARRIKPYLDTRAEMDVLRRDTPEFRNGLRKAMERQKIEPLIAEWRELGKQLDPDDPTLTSIEELRYSAD